MITWPRIAVSIALILAGTVGTGGSADAAGTCTHRVQSDFNGDGYADIAAGAPFRTVAGVAGAGAVRILYGSASGVRSSHYFDQDSPGIPGAPTAADEFGLALASGFFNGDCYADLAIGTPGEDDVTILYGSLTGLTTIGDSQFHGRAHVDGFGFALAAGDLNHDGLDDLVASAPYAGNGAGEITTMPGSATGLRAPPKWISQGTAGVPGVNEPGDLFGMSLATGDFNGDGDDDIAIGVPFEDDGSATDAGSVTVLRGSTSGVTTTGAQLWTRPSGVEAGGHFGYSLATGDVFGDGRSDLVIGAPGSDNDRGAATFLPGSASGLTAAGSHELTQDTAGVPGSAEVGDGLGVAVAVGDYNADGYADVALGVPGEDLTALDNNEAVNAGTVDVLRGSPTGPTGTGATAWNQDSPDVPGEVETGDEFGSTLLTLAGTGLVIAAQLEDAGATLDVGSITLLPATQHGLTGVHSQTLGGTATGDELGTSLG